jgi:DHA2 family multidrug resistance protein
MGIDQLGIACMAVGVGSFIAFLEEGQDQDWFTSTFIQHCFELAVVFIPVFLVIELVGNNPVVNLRLLLNRNLAFASIVNFIMGAGLYGSFFCFRSIWSKFSNTVRVRRGST